ncbi:BhlA/UviB family holin-like peptide [Bacillus sp. JJ1503]|uniref:BhlA/UviB family holin-like peptide n=1 Tax=Bacillus sp. JJ1503 TaxID=3122956 RepID=UPI002FFF247E
MDFTNPDVIKYFLTQGPWAILFVWLLIYVMRNNREREGRLHDLLDKFSEKYDVVIEELRGIKSKLGGDK